MSLSEKRRVSYAKKILEKAREFLESLIPLISWILLLYSGGMIRLVKQKGTGKMIMVPLLKAM